MSRSLAKGFFFACLLSAAAVGCGQKQLPVKKTYPVQGTVLWKGKPVAFAIVRFIPKDNQGAEATGFTAADGTFSVRTYSNSEMDGAVPGEYEVKVEEFNGPEFLGPQPKKGEKPTKLSPEAKQATQTVHIDATDDNSVPIEL